MKDKSLEVTEIKAISEEGAGFGKGTGVRIINQNSELFSPAVFEEGKDFSFEFSMEEIGISVPIKLFHELERKIVDQYFQGNSCRFLSGRIKCRDEIKFGALTSAILEFQFSSEFALSLPIHLLLGSCTARECNFLLEGNHKGNTITMGTIIWQTIALEWNLDTQHLWVYRIKNTWSSVYTNFAVTSDSRPNFFVNLVLLVYHIFKYIFIVLLGLAILSLVVNCIVRRAELLGYFKGLLVKFRHRKGRQLSDHEEEDTVGKLYESPSKRRKMQRLPDELDDEL
jgi:hypothetical protein